MYIRTTKTVTEDFRVDMPEWIELALAGNKIAAIKALKAVSSYNPSHGTIEPINLLHAKIIVEHFMTGIQPVDYSKRDRDHGYETVDFDDVNR